MKTIIIPKVNCMYLIKPWNVLKDHEQATDDYRTFVKSISGQSVICDNPNENGNAFSELGADYIVFYDMIERELIKETDPEYFL